MLESLLTLFVVDVVPPPPVISLIYSSREYKFILNGFIFAPSCDPASFGACAV